MLSHLLGALAELLCRLGGILIHVNLVTGKLVRVLRSVTMSEHGTLPGCVLFPCFLLPCHHAKSVTNLYMQGRNQSWKQARTLTMPSRIMLRKPASYL